MNTEAKTRVDGAEEINFSHTTDEGHARPMKLF